MPPSPFSSRTDARRPSLAESLRDAVLEQDFGSTADNWHKGAPLTHFPSIDLAVAAFPRSGPPRCANVLFSREHPQGVLGEIGPRLSALRNVRFERDLQDAKGNSVAWQAGRDWKQLPFQPLLQRPTGRDAHRFVAPYPASLLKLMVAVGVGMAVDRGLTGWPEALEPMITVSDNDATTECVALLHRLDMMGALNRRLAELDLATLQVNNTRPDGGWRNGDGAGVGQIHMTAWDTVRLLWLLDRAAPPPPWLPGGTVLLRDETRAHLHDVLRRQQLDEILSSGALRGQDGWVAGLPDAPTFAHKTGTTDNYGSDGGIVQDGATHYIVTVLTSLGQRYAPTSFCATTWRLPALGGAVHRLMLGLR